MRSVPRAATPTQLTRHDFGLEGAAYVRAYLSANVAMGGRLGRLLEGHDIEAGATWGFVPRDSPGRQRLHFEDSLFAPSGPAIEAGGGVFVPNFDPATAPQITAAFNSLLTRPRQTPRLLCVEDVFMRRSDFALAPDEWARTPFFCDEAVFEYAVGGSPLPPYIVRETVGRTSQPNVGIVTAIPRQVRALRVGDEINDKTLAGMAASAIAIIIGAWDGEAPMFWEPAQHRAVV